MGIKDLPGPGINFKTTYGPGSFAKKLSSITRYGNLKNLRDNREEIIKAVKGYERAIKVKGGLSRLQQRDAWLKIKKGTPKPTYYDRGEIKEILKHLGHGSVDKEKKSVESGKYVEVGGKKKYLSPELIKRNLNRARSERIYAESGNMRGGSVFAKQYAGGREVQSHGVMGNIGIERENTGFASNYKNSKLPDTPKPNIPPAGIRPFGL